MRLFLLVLVALAGTLAGCHHHRHYDDDRAYGYYYGDPAPTQDAYYRRGYVYDPYSRTYYAPQPDAYRYRYYRY